MSRVGREGAAPTPSSLSPFCDADIAKGGLPTAASSPAQARPPSSALRHRLRHTLLSPGEASCSGGTGSPWRRWLGAASPAVPAGPLLGSRAAPLPARARWPHSEAGSGQGLREPPVWLRPARPPPRHRALGLPARAPGGGGRWPEVTPACLLLPGLQPPQTRPWPARGPASDPALSSADCVLGDTQSGEQPRRSCTVYRPWFSPYSYFVCADVDSRLEAHGFPEAPWAGGRGDGGLPEDAAESICSSSSPEDTCPREAAPEPRPGPDAADRITPQDVLMASRWQPAQQSGYKCVACCRMYPSLRSLQSHIRGGFKEGFSCRVYYRRLKALWGREQWARPGDRLSSSASCQASP